MRASVMLFLPAHEFYNKIAGLIDEAGRCGLTVRGIYGEGSSAIGSFYQISNQGSLGLSEEEIIDEVMDFIYTVCREEKKLREELLILERDKVLDEGQRAYAILTNAHMLDEKECMELLSRLKLVCEIGKMEILDEKAYLKLYHECGSAYLREIFNFADTNENFAKIEEKRVRAEYISNKIRNLVSRR